MPDIDPLADLGVRQGPDGPTLRVFSSSAERLEVVIDDAPHDRVVPLTCDEHDVWSATDAALFAQDTVRFGSVTRPRRPR